MDGDHEGGTYAFADMVQNGVAFVVFEIDDLRFHTTDHHGQHLLVATFRSEMQRRLLISIQCPDPRH